MANPIFKGDSEARIYGYSRVSKELLFELQKTISQEDVIRVARELARIYTRNENDIILGSQDIILPSELKKGNVAYKTQCDSGIEYTAKEEATTFRQSDFVSALIGLAQWLTRNTNIENKDLRELTPSEATKDFDVILEKLADFSNGEFTEQDYIRERALSENIAKIDELLKTILDHIEAAFKQKIELPEAEKTEEKPAEEKQSEEEEADKFSTAKVSSQPQKPDPDGGGPDDEFQQEQQPPQKTTQTLEDGVIDAKVRYETQWLYNFTLHQIALQLGIPLEQLPVDQQRVIYAEVQKYLRNPANLAKLYDIKNADINRLNAFRDLVKNLKVVTIPLANGESKTIDLKAPSSTRSASSIPDIFKTVLGEELSQKFASILPPHVFNNISQQVELAIGVSGMGAQDGETFNQIINYIQEELRNAGVYLEPGQVVLLQQLLKSYVRARVSEKVLNTRNESVEQGVVTKEIKPAYDVISRQFGHQAAQGALTDTKDTLDASAKLLSDAEKSAAGSLNQKTYAKYKKLYGWWYGLDPDVQKIIIHELREIDKTFLGTYDPNDKQKYLLPYNIHLFNLASLPTLVQRAKFKNEYQKTAVFRAAERISSQEEERNQFVLQQHYTAEYIATLTPEYKAALLAYIIEIQQREIQQEIVFLQQLQQEEAVLEAKIAEHNQTLELLQQAALEDFAYANIVSADIQAYEKYTQDKNQFLNTYAPDEAAAAKKGAGFFSPSPKIAPPGQRHAQAIKNTGEKVKRGVEFGKSIALAGTGAGFFKSYATNKDFRLMVNIGTGGLAGLAYITIMKMLSQAASMAGGILGGIAGGVAGGALAGSVFGPIGTLIGAVAGGIGGAAGGAYGLPQLFGLGGGANNITAATGAEAASLGSVAESLGSTVTGGTGAAKALGSAEAGTASSTVAGQATAASTQAAPFLTSTAVLTPFIGLTALASITLYIVFIIQWSFLAPLPIGSPITSEPTFSQYLEITKNSSPNRFSNFTEGQSEEVSYSITIAPKAQYVIEIVEMKDTFSFLGEQGVFVRPDVQPLNSDNTYPLPADFALTAGQRIQVPVAGSYTATFSNGSNGLAKDVIVSNAFSLTYKVYDAQGGEITTDTIEARSRVTIGNPKLDGCWPTDGYIKQLPYDRLDWNNPPRYGGGSHAVPASPGDTTRFGSDAFDIAQSPPGNTVYAPFDGTAVAVVERNSQTGQLSGYGYFVKLKTDNGQEFIFAHLITKPFDAPRRVKAGDEIGNMGSSGNSTGSHTHYELVSAVDNPPGEIQNYVPDKTPQLDVTFVETCYDVPNAAALENE